jgi:two-component sensor histidine kinase
MTIVSTLAAQLEGCLEVRPSRGGTVELRFPVAHR